MTGLDTNILVRYLTRDDPAQYRTAKAFLESSCTPEQPGYVNHIVLCELVWVLKGAYGASKEEIVRILDQVLRTRQLKVQHRDEVRTALQDYKRSTADFADCLIGRLNQDAGCSNTVTFDQRAGVLEAWRTLEP